MGNKHKQKINLKLRKMNFKLVIFVLFAFFIATHANEECEDECNTTLAQNYQNADAEVNHTICMNHCASLDTPSYVNPGYEACEAVCCKHYEETCGSKDLSFNPYGDCLNKHCGQF